MEFIVFLKSLQSALSVSSGLKSSLYSELSDLLERLGDSVLKEAVKALRRVERSSDPNAEIREAKIHVTYARINYYQAVLSSRLSDLVKGTAASNLLKLKNITLREKVCYCHLAEALLCTYLREYYSAREAIVEAENAFKRLEEFLSSLNIVRSTTLGIPILVLALTIPVVTLGPGGFSLGAYLYHSAFWSINGANLLYHRHKEPFEDFEAIKKEFEATCLLLKQFLDINQFPNVEAEGLH